MNILILKLVLAVIVLTSISELNAQDCDCDCDVFNETDVYADFKQFSKKHIVRPTASPTTATGWNLLLKERCPKDYDREKGRPKHSFIDAKTADDVERDIIDSQNKYGSECNNNDADKHDCVWSKSQHTIIQMIKDISAKPLQYKVYVCSAKYFIAEREGRPNKPKQPIHFEGFSSVDSNVKEADDGSAPNCALLPP